MIQNLYMLKPERDAWYEEVESVVIRARSSAKARQIAQQRYSADYSFVSGPVDWLNPRDVKLRKLGEATPGTRQTEEVVLVDRRSA